jgi:branched-chain amino acid transport system substrate-binding protein
MSIAKSGVFSTYDLAVEDGAKLAVADINAKGGVLGRQLNIIDFDTASKMQNSGPGAKQLISQGANFIIGTADYDFGGPAAREADSEGIASFGFAGDTKWGYHGIGPLSFNIFQGAPAEGAATAEFAYSKGWRKAYTLTDTINSYPATVTNWFSSRWEELGGKVVGKDLFLNSDPSIATQINRIKAAKPDVILLSSFPPGGATALKQIRAAGINTPVLGDIGFDGHYWYNTVPGLSNFYLPTLASQFGHDPRANINTFFAKLKKATGKTPLLGAYPMAGYSMVQLIAKGATDAKSTDGKSVAAAIEKLKGFPTLFGPTTYSWREDCNVPGPRPIPYTQVQKGVQSYVKTIVPKSVPKFGC